MTNDTKAPELCDTCGAPVTQNVHGEFRNTCHDHALALALVAAAYEDVAKGVAAKVGRHCHQDSFMAAVFEDLAKAIRARTPDDATEALERVKREARNESLREAKARLKGQLYGAVQVPKNLILAAFDELITEDQSDD